MDNKNKPQELLEELKNLKEHSLRKATELKTQADDKIATSTKRIQKEGNKLATTAERKSKELKTNAIKETNRRLEDPELHQALEDAKINTRTLLKQSLQIFATGAKESLRELKKIAKKTAKQAAPLASAALKEGGKVTKVVGKTIVNPSTPTKKSAPAKKATPPKK